MTITALTQQKRNPDNVNVFLDDKFWISLSKNQVIGFEIFKGKEIDDALKLDLEKGSTDNKLMEKIYNFIYLRPRSVAETKMYLIQRRKIDEEQSQGIIDKLIEKDLISDERFADFYIRGHQKRYGVNKIKAELMKKQIPREIIENKLSENLDDSFKEEEQEIIIKLIEKIKPKIKAKNEYELKSKLINRLMAKGYRYDDFRDLIE